MDTEITNTIAQATLLSQESNNVSSPKSTKNSLKLNSARAEIQPLLSPDSHPHSSQYVPLIQEEEKSNSSRLTMTPNSGANNAKEAGGPTLIQIEPPPQHQFTRSRSENEINGKHGKILNKPSGSYCRTFASFLFVYLSMTINLTVLAVIHERVPQVPTLPDTGFLIFPRWDGALSIAEYIIVAQVSGVILLLFMHRYRLIIFRRLCLIMGVLYLFRAISMASTQVPVANKNYYCSPKLNMSTITTGDYISTIASRVFYMSLGMGLSINGRHSYCGDYIYSGHTVILTLSYLMMREYLMPQRCRTLLWKCLNGMLILTSLTGVICIIISRGHYLIDIVIAYFFTTRIFWIYHTLCYNNILRFKSPTNYLSRVWWWPLFKYFEDFTHVNSCPAGREGTQKEAGSCLCCDRTLPQVPRSFEWPLPWPRILRRRTVRAHRLLLTPA